MAAALLLLTTFSLQRSVLYSQIIQQSSYAQEPAASPITDGNNASSSSTTTTDDNNDTTTDRITPEQNDASEDQRPLPVEPDRGPGGQPGEPGGPTTEPQQQPPPQQTIDDDNNLTQTDGILTATINGANFTRNHMIEIKGKVDDADITPESGVWIAIKDPTNETTHIKFVSLNASDRSFSYGIVTGYYDGNSRGFYKPMSVSGNNYTMTVAYNTDDEPSTTTTPSSGNNKSSLEVQFVFAYDHSITTEPQPQPKQTDGILTATINGANFVRNHTISVEGKVDDEVITPESGVWIAIKDPTNETTHIDFAPVNMSDRSFSYSIVAGYYDGNSYGFYKPMSVSGNNYTMTVAYNTDDGPSSSSSTTTPSSGKKSSLEVQFVFAYDHSITTPVSAAVTADTDTEPDSVASQFAGNQSTITTITPTVKTKTNGLLTAMINSSYFTTNQTIKVNGTVREAAGPFIAVYVELKDPQDETLLYEFAPIVRSNRPGSDNDTSFSYSLVAGALDDANTDTRRFWKPMNETGSNYTMIVGYATPPPSSPGSAAVGGGGENSRSEVQFVFAYEHLPPEGEEGAAVAVATTTTTIPEEPEPVAPIVEPEETEEEEESEDDDGDDCDNSYPNECIPPPTT
jgi:hypothetical protein